MDAEADVGLASPVELLKEKSFSRCSQEELSQLAELMSRIDLSVPRRRTRRREAARAGLPDLRRTLRRSFRTGGDPLERAWRRRRRRPRRLILLLDVSGSMDAYSRALVMFAHAALRSDPALGGLLLRHAPDADHARPHGIGSRRGARAGGG